MGLEGVTLGTLAEDLGLSKSGLFAHFRSKEALQLAVLMVAVERFIDTVGRAAISAPAGAPRVRALFDNWLRWFHDSRRERGCFFLSLSAEYDDRIGPVRDAVVASQKQWLGFVAGAAERAIQAGHFRSDLDCQQFAYEFVGIEMSLQFSAKLVGDPVAESRARAAFDSLYERSLAGPKSRRIVPSLTPGQVKSARGRA